MEKGTITVLVIIPEGLQEDSVSLTDREVWLRNIAFSTSKYLKPLEPDEISIILQEGDFANGVGHSCTLLLSKATDYKELYTGE